MEKKEKIIIIEQYKNSLINRATGKKGDENDFKNGRELLVKNYGKIIPDFIKIHRTLEDFWGFIKFHLGGYAERRTYINNEINAILDIIEKEEGSKILSKDDLNPQILFSSYYFNCKSLEKIRIIADHLENILYDKHTGTFLPMTSKMLIELKKIGLDVKDIRNYYHAIRHAKDPEIYNSWRKEKQEFLVNLGEALLKYFNESVNV